jgi:hypothetical protein
LRPFMLDKKTQKTKNMAHAWNPSYWGGWEGVDHSSRSAQAGSLGDPYTHS